MVMFTQGNNSTCRVIGNENGEIPGLLIGIENSAEPFAFSIIWRKNDSSWLFIWISYFG